MSFLQSFETRYSEPLSVYYISSLFRSDIYPTSVRFSTVQNSLEREKKKWSHAFLPPCNFVDLQGERSQWLLFLKSLSTEENVDFLLYWNASFTPGQTISNYLKGRRKDGGSAKVLPLKLYYDTKGVPIGCYIPYMRIQYVIDWWIKNINNFDFTGGWKKMENAFPDFEKKVERVLKDSLPNKSLQLSDLTREESVVTTLDERLLLGTFVIIIWDIKHIINYILYLKQTLGIDMTSNSTPSSSSSSSYQNHFIFPRNSKMSLSLYQQFLEEYDTQVMSNKDAWKIRSMSTEKLKTVNLTKDSPYVDELWRKFLLREALRFFEQDVKENRFSFIFQGTILSKDFFNRIRDSSSSFISLTSTELMLEAKIILQETCVKKQVLRSSSFISKGDDMRDFPCFMSCGTQNIPKLLTSIMFEHVFFRFMETDLPVASFAPHLFTKEQSDFVTLNKSFLCRTPLSILDTTFEFPDKLPKTVSSFPEKSITLQPSSKPMLPVANALVSSTGIGTTSLSCITFVTLQKDPSKEKLLQSQWKSVPNQKFISLDTYEDICDKFSNLQNDGISVKLVSQALPLFSQELVPAEIKKILLSLLLVIGWGGTVVDGDTWWRPHIRWQSLSAQTQKGQKSIFFLTHDPESFHTRPFLRSIFVSEAWQPVLCNMFLSFVYYLNTKYCSTSSQDGVYDGDVEEEDHIREDSLKLDCFMHSYVNEEVLVLPMEVTSDSSLYADNQSLYKGGAYLGKPTEEPFVLTPFAGFNAIKEMKIVMLTKDNNDYFKHFFFPKMKQVEKRFPNILFKYYFFENGSVDGTLSTLEENAQQFTNRMTIYTEKEFNLSESDLVNLDGLERSHRIGILRNTLVNKIMFENQSQSFCENKTSDDDESTWVLLLDTNILFNCNTIHQLLIDGVQYSGSHAAVCGNIEELKSGVFYDTLSYNYGEYFYRRDEFCTMMINSRNTLEGSLLHDVETAFGGMMLLRQKLYFSCRWGQYLATLKSSSTSLSCEHYHFCRMLKTYGNIGISVNTRGLYIENWQTEMKKNWLTPYLAQLVHTS